MIALQTCTHRQFYTVHFDLAACTQAQREVDERMKEMKVAQLQIEKLQCSLSYEQERCFTLDLELSTTRDELQKKKEQSGRLEMELQQLKVEHQEVVSGLKSAISNFFPHIYIYNSLYVTYGTSACILPAIIAHSCFLYTALVAS